MVGGPLYRLGVRLGLVRDKTNTVLIGLILGPALWLAIVALALIERVEGRLFDMALVASHARLLMIIPLFFVGESWVAPRMAAFVATIARNGVVPPTAQPVLGIEVARVNRSVNWWWPEALCLLVAVAMGATGARLQIYGVSDVDDPSRRALGAIVYFEVGLTVFRFLVFRWAWKLALWTWCLWRISRLDLQLM